MHRSSPRRLHSIPLRLLSASLLFTQALLIQTLFIQAGAAQSAMVESALSTQEREMVSWVADQEDDMVTLLERLTNINTGTLNKDGVAEVIGLLNTELLQLGFDSRTLAGDVIEMPSCPGSEYTIDLADHLLATKSGEGKR
ncbi:hypothetical protein N9762_06835, partial [Gammaproteobacteria bacterium]|nr:hypothetical protein [Gammaproteobacteria bacterium]